MKFQAANKPKAGEETVGISLFPRIQAGQNSNFWMENMGSAGRLNNFMNIYLFQIIVLNMYAHNVSPLSILLDDPNIRVSRSLNETESAKRHGPAGPGGEKYIETLVVVDPKMANFHGEDAAKQYALSACNIVSAI